MSRHNRYAQDILGMLCEAGNRTVLQAAVAEEEERKAHLAALADEWDEEHRDDQ